MRAIDAHVHAPVLAEGAGLGGDRVGDEQRVVEAVDRAVRARGEHADDAAEDRRDERSAREADRGLVASIGVMRRAPRRGGRSCAPRCARRRPCRARASRRASRSAAGRGRGPGESGRGTMPRPLSRMTTVSRWSSIDGVDLEIADVVALVGVDDDVRARLGDRELDVGERLLVDAQRLGEAAEGVPDDRDVLGAGRQLELQVGRGGHLFGCVRGRPRSDRHVAMVPVVHRVSLSSRSAKSAVPRIAPIRSRRIDLRERRRD